MTTRTPRRAYPDVFQPAPADAEGEAAASVGLTADDHGRLDEATRRVLVALLRGPYVNRERHSKLWPSLVRDEAAVRERLGDLFLELVLDREAGLAYVRNLTADGVDVPRVIRSTPLTLIDTVLVLFLRDKLLRGDASDRRVFVGRDEIDDHVAVYRSATSTDATTFAKRVNASVLKLKNASVLLGTAEDDRFEVSPILGMLFDADEVLAVTAELRALIEGGVPAEAEES
jgi:Domain of unknown function (DUF4194)